MAFRATINSVLRRLREDTISSDWSGALVDATGVTDYQKMIGDLVNEVKREVEDAWDWTTLRSTVTVSTVSGTQTYTITGTNQRMRVISVIDQGTGTYLQPVSDAWIKRAKYPTSSVTTSRPYYYSINGTSSGAMTVDMWAKPDGVYSIDFNVVDPQDDLSSATDSLSILENIVVLGAWARAIAERGEDGGSLSDMAMTQYQQALADAIGQDANRNVSEITFNAS